MVDDQLGTRTQRAPNPEFRMQRVQRGGSLLTRPQIKMVGKTPAVVGGQGRNPQGDGDRGNVPSSAAKAALVFGVVWTGTGGT